MKKLLIIAFLIISSLLLVSGNVLASEAEQSQSQEAKAECETETIVGPYGQTTTRCKIDLKQKQSQKIVYVESGSPKTHQPADTATDGKMVAVALSTVVSGTGAFLIKLKQKLG